MHSRWERVINMSNYVITFPLSVEKWKIDIINNRLEVARNIYNACLSKILENNNKMIKSKRYKEIMDMEDGKEKKTLKKALTVEYGVNGSYDAYQIVKPMYNHFKGIDSAVGSKIGKRAYITFEKITFGTGKKAHFKRKGEFNSVEGNAPAAGIIFKEVSGKPVIVWNKLTLPVIIDEKDAYNQMALEDKLKYCRIVRRYEKGKERFYVQLILEGIPPLKPNQVRATSGRVGIDIGTQTIAIVTENETKLLELAPEIDAMEKEKRILQRKIDRQRRANNPHKFNEDGTIIKGNREPWIESKNYLKTKSELQDLNRVIARKRELSHNKLANYILSLGNDIRVEKMNYQGLQKRAKETTVNEKTGKFNSKKRFGKSLANKAPAMLLEIIDRKLKYQGLELKKIDTYSVKASQFNHLTGEYVKKGLGERWNDLDGHLVQRDLYSAFLIMNTSDDLKSVDVNLCNETYEQFLKNHDKEIQHMKDTVENKLGSFGI